MTQRNAKRKGSSTGRESAKTTVPVCETCGAKCCHDLVVPVRKPKTPGDVEDLKWHLMYESVHLFIRSHRWYLLFRTRCMYLDADNRCTIYERRPRRCRDMKPPDCEHFGDFYETIIRTPQELDAHLARAKRR